MAAAEITPSVVQKETGLVADAKTGTPVAFQRYRIKLTKATQNDWIVLTTATGLSSLTGKVVGYVGTTTDSSNNSVQETMTFTETGAKLTFTSATVGTTWAVVDILR